MKSSISHVKTIVMTLLAATLSCASFAAPTFRDAGPTLTDGASSSHWTALYATRNPAGAEFSISPESKIRMGVLSSLGIGVEVGPVDDFVDEIDGLIEQLDRDDISLAEGQALVQRFNALLGTMARDGYAKVHAGAHVPFFPMLIRSKRGVVTLNASFAGLARLGLLDAPVTYNALAGELETASAVYVKGATLGEVALGFARPVWSDRSRQLTVGTNVRYLQAALSKQVVALQTADDDVEDIVKDTYDANEHESSHVTLDIGAIYSTDNYRIGLTLANLTEPEFKYGTIGNDCHLLSGSAQHNCYAPRYFSDRLALSETWTLERLATVEGAWFFADGRGTLSGALDLNEVRDPVGDLNQSFAVSLGYKTLTRLLPDVCIGYRKNLAGTKLDTATFGMTFFRRLHLDVAWGLKSTVIDDRSMPRNFALNLGFEMTY